MKIDKITLSFLLVIVGLMGGSLGYAIKPEYPQSQISYEQQQEACVRAITLIEGMNRKKFIQPVMKTKKQIAIDRMMSN